MKKITLPLKEEDILSLKAGDSVLLSGKIYTARDAAHKRIFETIQKKEDLPINIEGATIYYVGPTPEKEGEIIGSCGPTTSGRMDPYTPLLLDKGLKGMIGKGKRNQEVKEAIKKNKAIYFVAVGGAGAYLSKTIKKKEVIAYPELLSEAIVELTIEDFPCFVGIDAKGEDIYESC